MSRAPVFQKLPRVPVALVCLVAGVEVIFQLGARGIIGGAEGVGLRMQMISLFGFYDPLFEYMRTTGRLIPDGIIRFVSYVPIHAGAVHALMGSVLILALGKAVSKKFSDVSMALLMVLSAGGGALAYGLFQDGKVALIGAYPVIYGLIGAFTWIKFTGAEGRGRMMAFRLVVVLSGLQFLYLFTIGGSNDWIANLGGFVCGFSTCWMLEKGGAERLRRIRDHARRR